MGQALQIPKKSLLLSKTSDHASGMFPTQGTHVHTAVGNFSRQTYYLVLSSAAFQPPAVLSKGAYHGSVAGVLG